MVTRRVAKTRVENGSIAPLKVGRGTDCTRRGVQSTVKFTSRFWRLVGYRRLGMVAEPVRKEPRSPGPFNGTGAI
jgi:hypothetical protein